MQAPRSTGFRICSTCDGMGFLKAGDFADRTFSKCPTCKGVAQIYLDPAPEPKPDAVVACVPGGYGELLDPATLFPAA